MRRAQSVRHHQKSSLAIGVDDLGILREGEDSVEDLLRKQMIDKERECDRVCASLSLSLHKLSDSSYILTQQNRFLAATHGSSSSRSTRPTSANRKAPGNPEGAQESWTFASGYTKRKREMYEWLGTVRNPPHPPPFFVLWVETSHSWNFLLSNRAKNREKMLERELARIAGENWQVRPPPLLSLIFGSIKITDTKPL